MMSTSTYKEFVWNSAGPGNGQSGVGLADVFIERISALREVKSICDLGCGNGYLPGRLVKLGYNVTGVDASASGIALARANVPQARFVQATIDKKLPELEGLEYFNMVVSSDVIEHLYRPNDLIEAASSLLPPGGRLLIGTPYHGYLKNFVLSTIGKMDSHFNALEVGGHIKFFSVKTLSQLLTMHGFGDLEFTYYGRAPWLWKNMICLGRKT
jgi:2-polyprenyl-3-methyl-5-hydroxy-6-metoxy-1,4-benzoquinol methylase